MTTTLAMLASRNRAVERLLDPGERLVVAWRLDGRLTALTDRRLFRLERKWRSPRRGAELELDLTLSEVPAPRSFQMGGIGEWEVGVAAHGEVFWGVPGDYGLFIGDTLILKGTPREVERLASLISSSRGQSSPRGSPA